MASEQVEWYRPVIAALWR
jgi:hypothetical protein